MIPDAPRHAPNGAVMRGTQVMNLGSESSIGISSSRHSSQQPHAPLHSLNDSVEKNM